MVEINKSSSRLKTSQILEGLWIYLKGMPDKMPEETWLALSRQIALAAEQRANYYHNEVDALDALVDSILGTVKSVIGPSSIEDTI